MTAKRQPDGSTVYRGQTIKKNPTIRAGKLGHYTIEGVPFSQLATAKEYVDVLAKHELIERDPLI
ncbi:hypothetical protein GOD54_23490 [Sinorhizobium medicae]|nr:hypothetical protein [Sinorhizobium medicae]